MKFSFFLNRKLLSLVICFLLIVPLVIPLMQNGFPQTDDGNWMVIRLSAFHESLKTGQFPVRFLWRLNHGFGYPVTNFLYPLPFYLGEIVHFLGVGFTDSIKFLFGISFFLGALGMFFWIRRIWGSVSGVMAAVSYSYFPYRIYDVYVRGSLGESVAFVFLPWIFYFYDLAIERKSLRWAVGTALCLALLITAHNTVAFIFFPCFAFYAFVKWLQLEKSRNALVWTALIFLLGMSISAFFWIPAVFDLSYTKAGGTAVSNFKDFFISERNFLTLIGPVAPFVFVLAIPYFKREKSRLVAFGLVLTAIALFLSSSLSTLFWENLPLPMLVQFPWRMLTIISFTQAFLLAFVTLKLKKHILIAILVGALISTSGIFNTPIRLSTLPDSYYETNDDTTTVKNEYMPRWVRENPLSKPVNEIEILEGTAEVMSESRFMADEEVLVRVNKVYFPGIKLVVDDNELPEEQIRYEQEGFLDFRAKPGAHHVAVKFTETPLRMASNLLSAAVLLLSLLFLCVPKRLRKLPSGV